MSNISFRYESARYAKITREYSELTTAGECKEWAARARLVASYMSEAVERTAEFIFKEKGMLEEEHSKAEQSRIRMSLIELENFSKIIQTQLSKLTEMIDTLPTDLNDEEKVKLPKQQVVLGEQGARLLVVKILLLTLIIIAMLFFLMLFLWK